MPNSEPTPNSRSSRPLVSPPRFQFSLAWLLIAVTAVAITLGLAVTLGSLVNVVLWAVVCCIVPTPLVICAIFARGDTQAFAIGALVPFATLFAWNPGGSPITLMIYLSVISTACGVLAAATLRWVRRGGR